MSEEKKKKNIRNGSFYRIKQKDDPLAKSDSENITNKEKDKKFFSLSKFFIFLGIILALLIVLFIVSFFLFRVEKIEVHSTISAEKVITASGVRIGDSMLSVNSKDVESGIKFAYPYVTNVKLTKTYPGDIELRLYESTPYFYVKAYDKYLTLTSDLRVLESYSTENEAMIYEGEQLIELKTPNITRAISGEQIHLKKSGYDASVSDFIDHLTQSEYFTEINSIDLNSRFAFTIVYKNQLLVNLGKDENTIDKMEFLEKIYEKLEGAKGELDLSDVSRAYFIPNDELEF